jgi:hypothetical protein
MLLVQHKDNKYEYKICDSEDDAIIWASLISKWDSAWYYFGFQPADNVYLRIRKAKKEIETFRRIGRGSK